MRKHRVLSAFAAATVFVLAGPASHAQGTPAQQTAPAPASALGKSTIIEKVLVKVNGEILSQSELERMQIDALQQDQSRRALPRDLTTDPKLMAALSEVTPKLLVEAIDELLLVQRARELGMKFTDDNFKMALDNVKKENKFDDKQLLAAMQSEGLTMEQLRQNFEKSFLLQSVNRDIMKNLTLTEEEARQYYKAHPDQFMKPPTVTLREILIAVPTETVGGQASVNVAKDDEAREKANQIRARAQKGEDFVTLVTEASESGTKANGGTIGPILIAELAPAIGAVLEKLKPGEISDVIRTTRGYQIFKLETRTVAEPEPFDKVRNELAQRIYESRLDGEKEKYLQKLRTQAVIEWKDEPSKKMFEQGQADRAKGK